MPLPSDPIRHAYVMKCLLMRNERTSAGGGGLGKASLLLKAIQGSAAPSSSDGHCCAEYDACGCCS